MAVKRLICCAAMCAFCYLLFITPRAAAQAETGQIAGTVSDPTGALVPNAQVTVVDVATNATRNSVSGADGAFTVSNLLPAVYKVRVTAQGFKTLEQQVEIVPGAKVGLDIKLEVGAASTTVEVSASAATILVNTETQTVSQNISNQTLMALPIAVVSNPYSLVVTSGNVSEDDPSGRGVGVAINGMRSETTNVLLDGASNNDEFVAARGQAIPIDSVQEFNFLTSDFTAEYGRVGGGVVNLTTKSGTNDFHGSVYEYNRISDLASNSFYNNANTLAKGIYARNEFGYSVGGPVKKDKLYFFQSTEWTRVRSSSPSINYIVDPALVALSAPATQNFYATRGAKLVPGATVTAVVTRQDAFNLGEDPCGTSPAPGDPCGSIPMSTAMFDKVAFNVPTDAGGGAPQNTYDLVGRGDWNISNKTTLYGRYALYSEVDFPGYVTSSPYAGYNTGQTLHDNNIVVSLTHTFSPTLVSQTKAVYERLNTVQPLGTNPQGPTIYTNGTGEGSFLNYTVAFPGYNPYSPGTGIPFGGPQNFSEIYEDFSKIHGKHDFRFGGTYTYIHDNRTFAAYGTPGEGLSASSGIADDSMDNFISGTLESFTGAVNPEGHYPCAETDSPFTAYVGGNPQPIATPECTVTLPTSQPQFSRSNRYNEGALYLQDSWKATRRFTVNMGVRWEYFGTQHDKNPNLDSNFYPDFSQPSLPLAIAYGNVSTTPQSNIDGIWGKSWHNFGPRLGFAWDVFGNGKTSLRGGWGISYIRNFGNVTFNIFENPPNYAVVSLFGSAGTPLPITTSVLGPFSGSSGSIPLGSVELRAVNPKITTAYADTFNLDLQREVVPNVVVDIGYSGSKGVHLYDIANVNRPGAGNIYGTYNGADGPCNGAGYIPACAQGLASTQYTFINYRSDNGFSNYSSLNTRVTVRNVHHTGLTLVANWTWGHAIDNLSDTFSGSSNDINLGYLDPFDPKLDKGDAQFDNRQRIAISGIWEVPFFHSFHGVAKEIFDGWQFAPIFTARTGNPYSIYDETNDFFYAPFVMLSSPLPRNPQKPIPMAGIPDNYSILNECTEPLNPPNFGTCAYNSSYVNPIVGYSDWGPFPSNMTGRDSFRSPGDWNIDFGVHKVFKITERYNLEFRGEMFNMANHANLYVSNESYGGGAVINGPYDPPYIPADYNGNRNVQLAVRLTF